ncbi:hypothetical protein KW805_00730 [Candidatus Pacearchaeota archaeon]|nr:hypothetical protein [Candidatus Pacearchaeota archaeon]
MKRGLSDVVTTVLMILLVLAAIVIVWKFVRPTLVNAGQNIETSSLSTSLSVVPESVAVNYTSTSLGFVVKRNNGAGDVSGLIVTLEDGNGNAASFNYPNAPLAEFQRRAIYINWSTASTKLGNITKITVRPLVSGSAKQGSSQKIGKIANDYRINRAEPSRAAVSASGGSMCPNGVLENGEYCDSTSASSCTLPDGSWGSYVCRNDCTGYGPCLKSPSCPGGSATC